jgi:thiamine-phosphate pyrophosphorylase
MPPSQPRVYGLPLSAHGTRAPSGECPHPSGTLTSPGCDTQAVARSRDQRLEALDRASLYFVCDGLPDGRDPTPLLEAALRGGADMIQLREKAPRCAEELISLSVPFRRSAAEHGALFILNDRPDLVDACAADGAHVGQEDMAVAEARALAGSEAVIGLSTHSPAEIDAACAAEDDERPDQISVGPVWTTPTKEGRPATGLDLVVYAARAATIPWFAIGGIDTENASAVVDAGAERVVVVRAIRDATDPEAAAGALRAALGRKAPRPFATGGGGGLSAARGSGLAR